MKKKSEKKSKFPDPFEEARLDKGFEKIDDQNDPVTMVLRHQDVREYAKNWKTFQSGAKPGRIVVPSEEHIRDIRQIPFEVDPPEHGEYRALIEDWFRRPFNPEYQLELSNQINDAVDFLLEKNTVEIVSDFSLPVQSKALTLLLNVPIEEANTWIDWGVHVFRSEDNPLDGDKANILYDYLDKQIDKAIEHPSDNLYSVLLASEFKNRKLTKEEVKGVMILTFAGGRDTVINTLNNSITYFAEHPEALERIRNEPRLINQATEELVRYFSPLTHMGRVVTEDSYVCKHAVKADSRISLCWASANRDASVFEKPDEVIIDRKKNPHVGFGFGPHKCLGEHHARQILKTVIKTLASKVKSIDILDAEENIEEWGDIKRKVGFERIEVNFNKRD